nr:protein SIEVE ELEMENT OCCLUSION B-like [Ipomoea batatas]
MSNFHIDENAVMELVCATHNPDSTNFNANVVLSAIEKILKFEKATDKEATEKMLEEFDLNFMELSLKIQHLCFEISEERYIFLYGGNDIKWIREFTSKVDEISFKLIESDIELIYVGKNEKVRASIGEEQMSYLLESPYHAWRFWTRLQSALLSRINYLNAANCHGDECNDEIAQGFKKLLGYECKGATMEGWAMLSKGQKVVVCGQGAKMLRVINEYKNWKENMALKSFDQAFKDYYNKTLHTCCSSNSHSCCAFEYPITLKEIPKKEKCPECFCDMQKLVTFTCYHGDS